MSASETASGRRDSERSQIAAGEFDVNPWGNGNATGGDAAGATRASGQAHGAEPQGLSSRQEGAAAAAAGGAAGGAADAGGPRGDSDRTTINRASYWRKSLEFHPRVQQRLLRLWKQTEVPGKRYVEREQYLELRVRARLAELRGATGAKPARARSARGLRDHLATAATPTPTPTPAPAPTKGETDGTAPATAPSAAASTSVPVSGDGQLDSAPSGGGASGGGGSTNGTESDTAAAAAAMAAVLTPAELRAAEEAQRSAARDWAVDALGYDFLDYERFTLAVFRLAERARQTRTAEDYAAHLERICGVQLIALPGRKDVTGDAGGVELAGGSVGATDAAGGAADESRVLGNDPKRDQMNSREVRHAQWQQQRVQEHRGQEHRVQEPVRAPMQVQQLSAPSKALHSSHDDEAQLKLQASRLEWQHQKQQQMQESSEAPASFVNLASVDSVTLPHVAVPRGDGGSAAATGDKRTFLAPHLSGSFLQTRPRGAAPGPFSRSQLLSRGSSRGSSRGGRRPRTVTAANVHGGGPRERPATDPFAASYDRRLEEARGAQHDALRTKIALRSRWNARTATTAAAILGDAGLTHSRAIAGANAAHRAHQPRVGQRHDNSGALPLSSAMRVRSCGVPSYDPIARMILLEDIADIAAGRSCSTGNLDGTSVTNVMAMGSGSVTNWNTDSLAEPSYVCPVPAAALHDLDAQCSMATGSGVGVFGGVDSVIQAAQEAMAMEKGDEDADPELTAMVATRENVADDGGIADGRRSPPSIPSPARLSPVYGEYTARHEQEQSSKNSPGSPGERLGGSLFLGRTSKSPPPGSEQLSPSRVPSPPLDGDSTRLSPAEPGTRLRVRPASPFLLDAPSSFGDQVESQRPTSPHNTFGKHSPPPQPWNRARSPKPPNFDTTQAGRRERATTADSARQLPATRSSQEGIGWDVPLADAHEAARAHAHADATADPWADQWLMLHASSARLLEPPGTAERDERERQRAKRRAAHEAKERAKARREARAKLKQRTKTKLKMVKAFGLGAVSGERGRDNDDNGDNGDGDAASGSTAAVVRTEPRIPLIKQRRPATRDPALRTVLASSEIRPIDVFPDDNILLQEPGNYKQLLSTSAASWNSTVSAEQLDGLRKRLIELPSPMSYSLRHRNSAVHTTAPTHSFTRDSRFSRR